MEGWQGDGFYLTRGSGDGPAASWGICSSDGGCPAHKALLTRTFKVPANVVMLRGRAFHNLGPGLTADHRLDVVLMDENRMAIPKQLLTSNGWVATAGLLPRWQGAPRDYAWDLSGQRGKTVKLIIRDQDDRPGCHVYATGFRFIASETPVPPELDDFPRFMLALEDKHKLPVMARFDSKRFTAISNASEKFTRLHLRYCEFFYDLFVDHFRRKGFAVQPPAGQRLMIAVFCEPKGFEAYLGRRMPAGITGVYHTPSNRLVLYDLSQNAYLLASRDEALKRTEFGSPHDRLRMGDTVERRYKDAAKDLNVGTTMHECAHLLSFNSGLLRRDGDIPVWLAEGLATYCESTDEGDWQLLGSPNPMRIDDLRHVKGGYMSVTEMLRDDWLRSPRVLLGYAQSWALYRMLMEQRPQALAKYLRTVWQRNAPESRLTDFAEAFGNVEAFDRHYRTYMDGLIARHPPRAAR
jgi:hypothetical protein